MGERNSQDLCASRPSPYAKNSIDLPRVLHATIRSPKLSPTCRSSAAGRTTKVCDAQFQLHPSDSIFQYPADDILSARPFCSVSHRDDYMTRLSERWQRLSKLQSLPKPPVCQDHPPQFYFTAQWKIFWLFASSKVRFTIMPEPLVELGLQKKGLARDWIDQSPPPVSGAGNCHPPNPYPSKMSSSVEKIPQVLHVTIKPSTHSQLPTMSRPK